VPGEGEGLGGLVAGAVAGDNGQGIVAVILLEAKREFAVGGNLAQAAVD